MLLVVPQGKGKHSIQSRQRRLAPLLPCRQQNFSISFGPKLMTFRGQLTTQLAIVINLAVERDHKPRIMRDHRFVARIAGVDDRQASMAQTDALSLIYRRRCPDAFIIATAMLDRG